LFRRYAPRNDTEKIIYEAKMLATAPARMMHALAETHGSPGFGLIYGTDAMSGCTPIRNENDICVILSDQRERRISRLRPGRFFSRSAPSE